MELLLKHSALLHAACRARKRRESNIRCRTERIAFWNRDPFIYSFKENQGAPSPPSSDPRTRSSPIVGGAGECQR